ncbi:hypothetical protein H2200_000855 [Cladophialophora chaetospira]|uniref:GH16 domain-containing protein n=1 Tax=Cladophialophora chaetospira TaxID=386627 RepID=A0AA38XPB4_9EURO|nr:hypothetical protein H2200_000855 [Cladophialophora chaetospira]
MPAPDLPGFAKVWSDDFDGPASSPPNAQNWTLETPPHNYNNEQQVYTNSTDNAFLNGSGQLCIAPRKVNGKWTSARMHGNASFACDNNHKMIFSAHVKVGQNSPQQQQGIWPAWWTLGQSIQHGTQWPKCCEWDIMELKNGTSRNQGTVHQTDTSGNHTSSFGFADFSRQDFHTWSLLVDLTSNDYNQQTLNWQLDGQTYFTVHGDGSSAATRECWDRCGRSAFFPILNVAVGGDFVGSPNDGTVEGVESGLTLQWVAVYKSNT